MSFQWGLGLGDFLAPFSEDFGTILKINLATLLPNQKLFDMLIYAMSRFLNVSGDYFEIKFVFNFQVTLPV